MSKAYILVVEDDRDTRELVVKTLEGEGFKVKYAESLMMAKSSISKFQPDVVILDRGLPDGDGLELCKHIKKDERTSEIPILFLTAKDTIIDKVVGLKMGGDDYLPKPFDLQELIARVEVILRRLHAEPEKVAATLEMDGIILDIEKHECTVNKKIIDLWPKEFELLKTFMERPNRLLTRDFLCNHIWGWDFTGTSHTIDATVQRLRKKIENKCDLIETVKNYGYRFHFEKK